MKTLTRAQMRKFDQQASEKYGVPSIVLMENAGRGVADTLEKLTINGPVVIVCGTGNNGGDGLVAARHLDLRGHKVHIVLLTTSAEDPSKVMSGDTATNWHIARKYDLATTIITDGSELKPLLAGVDWTIDALLGTGARGEPRAATAAAIDIINAHASRVLAVDVPSGLDCDTGEASHHTIKAMHTCTMAALKPGLEKAEAYTGKVTVCDIGVRNN